MDASMAGKKFYKGFACNMMTLSEKGIAQIHETAKDSRLQDAELIITSPYGRTMHSAAILSKDINIEMRVETDLYEWLADAASYEFLPDEAAEESYRSLTENQGRHPKGAQCLWESAGQNKGNRIPGVAKFSCMWVIQKNAEKLIDKRKRQS